MSRTHRDDFSSLLRGVVIPCVSTGNRTLVPRSPIRTHITFWSTHARHHPALLGTRSRLLELFRAVL
ncbi:hypothetical protein [Rhodococcus sp. (in: high G+C Gram-positive bacteria)]|uniref:hypothetical protein n=1 Tax=Rhodococcus sp. TaxID=1831 RepID=UPI0038909BDC